MIAVKKITEEEKKNLGVDNWPLWSCEPSTFDWYYDSDETCYIIEGRATVKTKDQEVSFGPGDLVKFPKGLSCTWIVHEAVKKRYSFS